MKVYRSIESLTDTFPQQVSMEVVVLRTKQGWFKPDQIEVELLLSQYTTGKFASITCPYNDNAQELLFKVFFWELSILLHSHQSQWAFELCTQVHIHGLSSLLVEDNRHFINGSKDNPYYQELMERSFDKLCSAIAA